MVGTFLVEAVGNASLVSLTCVSFVYPLGKGCLSLDTLCIALWFVLLAYDISRLGQRLCDVQLRLCI